MNYLAPGGVLLIYYLTNDIIKKILPRKCLALLTGMSLSMAAPSSGIKIHTKKLYQQMALILLCEEVIEPTASAVTCVKNDRICDIIFQLYPFAWCQIIHLTKTRTESENSEFLKQVIPETSNS